LCIALEKIFHFCLILILDDGESLICAPRNDRLDGAAEGQSRTRAAPRKKRGRERLSRAAS
jgi:hypothetical protein